MEAQHWLTRSFRDAALEGEYRGHAAEVGRAHYRAAMAIGTVLWFGAIASDAEVGVTAANTQHLQLLRALSTALVLPTILVGWVGAARFARWWQPAAAAGVSVIAATIVAMNATVPEPASFDHALGLTGLTLVVVASHTMVPIRFVYALAVCVVWSAAFGVVMIVRYSYAPQLTITWLLLGNLGGATASVLLEQSRRQVFLYGRSLAAERARSDALLANLLPAAIAARLRVRPETIAESFDDVTVLFADLVGFTPLAARLPPAQLVSTLDAIFTEFDVLADRHGLEKIKTIGDAYMLVAGAPRRRDDHAAAAAEMALAMRAAIDAHPEVDGSRLSVRIGLHSGPVVAGVIGRKRPFYDLWGDTVNLASRMESHSVPGGIQVTEPVYLALRHRYRFEDRGAVTIKGKGEVRTWLLHGRGDEPRPLDRDVTN